MADIKIRSEKDEALKALATTVRGLTADCEMQIIGVATTTTGTWTEIQNIGIFPVTIDVSECVVDGIADFPAANFQLEPGASLYGNWSSVGTINTWGVSGLDQYFIIGAVKTC